MPRVENGIVVYDDFKLLKKLDYCSLVEYFSIQRVKKTAIILNGINQIVYHINNNNYLLTFYNYGILETQNEAMKCVSYEPKKIKLFGDYQLNESEYLTNFPYVLELVKSDKGYNYCIHNNNQADIDFISRIPFEVKKNSVSCKEIIKDELTLKFYKYTDLLEFASKFRNLIIPEIKNNRLIDKDNVEVTKAKTKEVKKKIKEIKEEQKKIKEDKRKYYLETYEILMENYYKEKERKKKSKEPKKELDGNKRPARKQKHKTRRRTSYKIEDGRLYISKFANGELHLSIKKLDDNEIDKELKSKIIEPERVDHVLNEGKNLKPPIPISLKKDTKDKNKNPPLLNKENLDRDIFDTQDTRFNTWLPYFGDNSVVQDNNNSEKNIKHIDIQESLKGNLEPEKKQISITATTRNMTLVKYLKNHYQDKCQICGEAIEISKGEFVSEVHHIQPLGAHDGADVIENMIVLCPNHHAMFDRGAITIDLDKKLVLHCNPNNPLHNMPIQLKHEVERNYLQYHNCNIFLNPQKPEKDDIEETILQLKSGNNVQFVDYGNDVTLLDISNREEFTAKLEERFNRDFMKPIEKLLLGKCLGEIIQYEGFKYKIIKISNR